MDSIDRTLALDSKAAAQLAASADVSGRWLSDRTARGVLDVVHYAYPIILLLVFLVAFTAHSIVTAPSSSTVGKAQAKKGPGGKPLPKNTSPSAKEQLRKESLDFSSAQKTLFNWLLLGVIVTFVGNAVNIVSHALKEQPWWCGQAVAIYVISSVFVYGLVLLSILDTKPAPTLAHATTWGIGLILELILLGASISVYATPHREVTSVKGHELRTVRGPTIWEAIEITLNGIRLVFLVALLAFYGIFAAIRSSRERSKSEEQANGVSEHSRLLNGHSQGHSADYGSSNGSNPESPVKQDGEDEVDQKKDIQPGWVRPKTAPSKSWWEYLKGYSLFFPYLWPANSRKLQLTVIICFILVMLQRWINALVPYQVGKVTNKLSSRTGTFSVPWGDICLFIFYKTMQGPGGILGAVRSVLWIPVSQYSFKALSTSSFEHVHGLSLDFHLGKKTGEVLSALSKGNSINTFLEQITFSVVPMLIDLGVAITYFLVYFDAYYALVISIVTFCYLYLTIRLAQWRAEVRREMTNRDREQEGVKNDSMVSYETVKYFNAEAYEFDRYRGAVERLLTSEYTVSSSLQVMNVSQNMVFMLGLLVTCFIAAYQVTTGQRRVGDFVSLLTYMAQLQQPLNFFGTFYRSIQSAMINSERLLELFKEQATVVDGPDVEPLVKCEGEIRFDDVQFSYDERKPALKGLSFTAAPGTTTALVGESGGGKSTVFRLLFRFYNIDSGQILIDGHDVRDISIDSVRRHIGVVPQDTVLFNESLMYNLKYANQGVTDEEVYDACRAASIHDKIMGFPDKYATKVGERGLRLSGGEKQRVAIARTILKNPKIILLDEATAALDSETEQHIQGALSTLSEGRTMLVIAHRLSTITTADQILVLYNGQVVEAGTHSNLINRKGRYASMWRKQIRAERAAEEARVLKDRAEMLRKEQIGIDSVAPSENVSEDESHTHGKKSDGKGMDSSRAPNA